jgi:hypothetical protein
VTQVGNDGISDKQIEWELMNLGSSGDIMLGSIYMAPGVQPHVYTAHDLSRAAGSIVFFNDLQFKLHILFEARRRSHGKILRIQFQTDVYDFSNWKGHNSPRLLAYCRSIRAN